MAVIVAGPALGTAGPAIPSVPEGHPRVYVRPADVVRIREKVKLPEFHQAWAAVSQSQRPFCKGIVYLVTGERAVGREAVEGALANLLKKTKRWDGQLIKDGRPITNHMHKAACVYDWCYPLLTEEEKQAFIQGFKEFSAADHERGYPPKKKVNAIVGHDSEGCIMTNLLQAGIAIHDEDPEMYRVAADIFFTTFIEPRNALYQGHMHHQGHHYHAERFQHDLLTAWLFRRLGAGDVFSAQQQFMPYEWLYLLRPDRKFFAHGDGGDDAGVEHMKRLCLSLAGAYYRDPYILTLFDDPKWSVGDFWYFADLLFLEAGLERRPLQELPAAKYFGTPMGDMVTRTGWDIGDNSRDAAVHMRMGQFYFSNHHHSDFGTFQIHYRGPLALDTGIYWGSKETCYGSPHWRNYYIRTLAHNGLLISNPATDAETFAGQVRLDSWRLPDPDPLLGGCQLGRVFAHAVGPNPQSPEFGHLAGDITAAYPDATAESVRRSMVSLHTGIDGMPLVFAVFDEVTARSPAFRKTWLLHCIQEPAINGRTATVVRAGPALHGGTYGGQLVVTSLLPEAVRLTKVGGPGRECWNATTGENYMPKTNRRPESSEIGAWRIEIVPTTDAAQHRFLTIMAAMDQGAEAPLVEAICAPDAWGARVLNRAVIFRAGEASAEPLLFTVPGKDNAATLVCGLAPGTWTTSAPDGRRTTQVVSGASHCAYLSCGPGEWVLAREGDADQ